VRSLDNACHTWAP